MTEKRVPKKGDMIRTSRGNFARVNWVKVNAATGEGELGATYSAIAPYTGLENMVFKLDEVTVVKSGLETFFGDMFKRMTDDELREELKRERGIRTTPPTETQQTKRRDSSMLSMLKELSPEEIAELKKWKADLKKQAE
jgi:hypothetical protein